MATDYEKIRELQHKIDRIDDKIDACDNLKDTQKLRQERKSILAEILKLKQLEITE